MNRQKEREEKDLKQWIDGYEYNLTLSLESLKNEHNDINKDKALQYNISKTILWINLVFVGLSIKVLEYHPNSYLFICFVFVSSLSIIFTLYGMLNGKYNAYASIGNVKVFSELPNDKWIKANGLLAFIEIYKKTIKYNGIALIKRSRWIRLSKFSSIASFALLLALSVNSQFSSEECLMGSKPSTPTKSVITQTLVRRSNESASEHKPKAPVQPNKPKK